MGIIRQLTKKKVFSKKKREANKINLHLESLERRQLLSFSWEGAWYLCGFEFSNADEGVLTDLEAQQVIHPFTITDLPGNNYLFSMTGNDWDLEISFTENGDQLDFEENGYNSHNKYESGAGQLTKITDDVIGFIGGVGRYSDNTLQDIIYSDALVGI